MTLKSPKEQKSGGDTIVDVFESGGPLCPVKAFLKWKPSISKSNRGYPIFRKKNGTPLTTRKLNQHLKTLLGEHIPKNTGTISSHSFRIGIASLLGTQGFSDKEIMQAGRWSSRAFERYMKLPRTKRAEIAKKIGSL